MRRRCRSMGVPAGVADVILRRMGRVAALTRDALTAAAVIGREFDAGPAQVVLGEPFDRVIEALEEAIAHGLIVEVEGQVDRFSFCHALVREAIYGRLSTSRRLRLHLRVGEALEGGAGIEAPSAAEMAHHFFLARSLGGAERAVRYSMAAGDGAAAAAAYEEAVEHYRRALEALVGDESARCDVLLALGRAQWQAGEAEARTTYLQVADERAPARRVGAARVRGARAGRALLGGDARRPAVPRKCSPRCSRAVPRGGLHPARPAARTRGREPALHRRARAGRGAERRGAGDGAPARRSRHARQDPDGAPRRAAAHRSPRRAAAADRRAARVDARAPRALGRGAPLAGLRPLRGG